MASVRLNGDTSGFIEISAPNVAGSTTITLPATSGGNFLVTDSNGDLNVDSGTLFVDASTNRVGIGTTSPNYKLHLHSATTGYSNYLQITHADAGSGTSDGLQLGLATGSSPDAYLAQKENGDLIFQTNAQDRARIDSSGRLLVGLTSDTTNTTLSLQGRSDDSSGGPIVRFKRGEALPTDELSLGNIFFSDGQNRVGAEIQSTTEGNWSASSTPTRLGFFTTPSGSTSSVERMRINANGGFRAKSSTASYVNESAAHHEMVVTGNNNIMNIYHTDSTGGNCGGLFLKFTNAAPNGTGLAIRFDDSSAMRFLVRTNGGIANYQSNDSNLCDEREKKNIVDLDSTWDCLKQWELKKFHYNEDADTDDKRYGVIAQQVAQHCPEVIADWVKQDAAEAVLDKDGNVVTPAQEEIVRMGVKEQQMMWMAIKALQEAQTRIETLETANASLEARLTALEGGN